MDSQDLIFNCDPTQVTFLPGQGWTVTLTEQQVMMPHVQEAVANAERGDLMTRVKVSIPNSPVPMGERLSVRSHEGHVFHGLAEQVVTDPDAVREAMQSASPSAAIDVVQHRSGVSVNSRTLRGVHQASNTDADVNLIDDLALGKDTFVPVTPRPARTAIESGIRVARGYIFDRAASYRIGQLAVAAADMIADNQEFARLPYPSVWAELDQSAVLEGMMSRGGEVIADDLIAHDDRIGFLYTGHGVYSAARSKLEDGKFHSGWAPFAIRMGRPMTAHQRERFRKFMGGGDETIDRFLWGNAFIRLDRTRRAALRHYSGIDILLPDDIVARTDAPLRRFLQGGGAGDWKLALAVLLCIIRPGVTEQHVTREPQRKMTAKGMRKLVGLTSVTINISARAAKSRIRRGLPQPTGVKRWHEVRGHYMHNRTAREADCIHDWQEVEPNRWTCRSCGGKRAWREYPNGRGTAEAGVVAKNYKVTSKGG